MGDRASTTYHYPVALQGTGDAEGSRSGLLEPPGSFNSIMTSFYSTV